MDEALARLRAAVAPVTGVETVALAGAFGRVLAEDVVARRSSPPGANAAVDGWGFAHRAVADGETTLPVVAGRAAAGAPLGRPVPEGRAVRILTGALLPEGVDTVILQEDALHEGDRVAFRGPVRPRANTRRAGEDAHAGDVVLPAGRRVGAPDLALAASVGVDRLTVREPLRVGVLSTGDELASPGATADPARTYDANRPMLLAMLGRWGFEAVDLGCVPDERAALRRRLDGAGVHAVLTSGGASAGAEDHVSALLAAEGRVETWRVAVKPGRPLALGLWRGVPIFGLPGNPVAAFVCAAVFAYPALRVLAGGEWAEPRGLRGPRRLRQAQEGRASGVPSGPAPWGPGGGLRLGGLGPRLGPVLGRGIGRAGGRRARRGARRPGALRPLRLVRAVTLRIAPGFAEEHRAEVARLFWEAFGDKLRTPLGDADRAVAYIARSLDPAHAISAAEDGRLIGVAGIKTRSHGLLAARRSDLLDVYGPLGALWRGALLAFYDRPVERGVMLMDGLFVAPRARGRGVGTTLLEAVSERAWAEGCCELRLDVVDGNRARTLYERRGFSPAGRIEPGWLGPILGVKGATTMRRPIA